jgi:hypothetical protein
MLTYPPSTDSVQEAKQTGAPKARYQERIYPPRASAPPIPACDYSNSNFALISSGAHPEILPASLVRRLCDLWFFTAMAKAFGSPMTTTSFLPRVTAV